MESNNLHIISFRLVFHIANGPNSNFICTSSMFKKIGHNAPTLDYDVKVQLLRMGPQGR
jgi:hypothetical protein